MAAKQTNKRKKKKKYKNIDTKWSEIWTDCTFGREISTNWRNWNSLSVTNKQKGEKKTISVPSWLLTNSSVFSRRLYKLQVLYTSVKEKNSTDTDFSAVLWSALQTPANVWQRGKRCRNIQRTTERRGAAADGRHRVAQAWGGAGGETNRCQRVKPKKKN